MTYHKAALGLLALGLAGCGTVNTVFRDDASATHALRKQRTYCESISRVYSGVAYDFCRLNAPPRVYPYTEGKQATPWVAIDLVASSFLDTLVLPYTIYQQNTLGSIEIHEAK
jgi:uncharacterized protein YceK